MLRPLPPADALLSFSSHRQATLWRIRRTDGFVFLFTDHDRKILFDGETYLPSGGSDTTARRQQRGLNPVNYDANGAITSDAITNDDLHRGKWRDAEVTEMLIDWQYPDAGPIRSTKAWWVTPIWDGEKWSVQVEGMARWLQQKIGYVVTRNCRWRLGQGNVSGIGCTVGVPGLTSYNVPVGSINIQRLAFTITPPTGLPTNSRNRWRFGRIIWTVGANAGFVCDILDYGQITATGVELVQPTPADILGSDQFDMEPGCDNIRATCIAEYNNIQEFGGLNFMPGSNAAVGQRRGYIQTNAPALGGVRG